MTIAINISRAINFIRFRFLAMPVNALFKQKHSVYIVI